MQSRQITFNLNFCSCENRVQHHRFAPDNWLEKKQAVTLSARDTVMCATLLLLNFQTLVGV